MMWWDDKLKQGLEKNKIQCVLMKRYVDDITFVLRQNPGDGESSRQQRISSDMVEDDERIMSLVQRIGNEIHYSIQLEIDFPSKYVDKKLPILDLKVWTKTKEIDDVRNTSLIMHEFYAKEISSKMVVHARAAMPMQMKRTILTQHMLIKGHVEL